MTKQMVYRLMIYLAGLLILALGLTLNTKAGLGVSAIISVSYCISLVLQLNFGDVTLGLYVVFVIIEMILHGIALKKTKIIEEDTGDGCPADSTQYCFYTLAEFIWSLPA